MFFWIKRSSVIFEFSPYIKAMELCAPWNYRGSSMTQLPVYKLHWDTLKKLSGLQALTCCAICHPRRVSIYSGQSRQISSHERQARDCERRMAEESEGLCISLIHFPTLWLFKYSSSLFANDPQRTKLACYCCLNIVIYVHMNAASCKFFVHNRIA